MSIFPIASIIPLIATCSIACGDATNYPDSGDGIAPIASSDTDNEGASDGASAGDSQEPAPLLDLGTQDEDELPGEPCASTSASAEPVVRPADIIFVIDNSGSMGEEAGFTQSQMNSVSGALANGGIDAHVALVSSYPGTGQGICIAPPLGGGGCPGADDNLPIFEHVDMTVSSSNALEKVIESYPHWSSIMRPDALKHVVVITDDESHMSAQAFDQQFRALHPSHADYRLHGIVSLQDCDASDGLGHTYVELANLTGGYVGDLCEQDFQPVFDQISAEVLDGSQLPCEFEVPPPPPGETFDPDQVNVVITENGVLETLGRVDSPGQCGLENAAWYYDNPLSPSLIMMCPETCARFNSDAQISVDIEVGCSTVPAG